MNKRLTLVLLALQACSLTGPDYDWSSFRIEILTSGNVRTPGAVVQSNNRPEDPHGMAGLVVELYGVDVLPSRMTITDIMEFKETEIPMSGRISFVVKLIDSNDQIIAELDGSWDLEPRRRWMFQLRRSPESGPRNLENPECWDPFGRCQDVWGAPIREDARNYPTESLWAVLYRFSTEPCPEGIVCN